MGEEEVPRGEKRPSRDKRSLLYSKVREEGLSYAIGSCRYLFRDGVFFFQVTVNSVDVDRVDDVVRILNDVPQELERAEVSDRLRGRRKFLELQVDRSYRDPVDLVEFLSYAVSRGIVVDFDRYVGRLYEELAGLAPSELMRGSSTTVILLPRRS